MFQLPIVSYPTRTFRLDSSLQYADRAFQSLTKHVPRQRVYGGILHTPHPDAEQIRYLLVQGRYSGKWSFPKGHSYEGEEPLVCARREIAEETGLIHLPDPVEYIRLGYGNYYVFICPFMIIPMPEDTGEIMGTAWVTLKEMGTLNLNVDVSRYHKKKLKQLENVCQEGNKISGKVVGDVTCQDR